ncbi:hypothetical protein ACHAQA_003183 [Verticillium albo-atrum]
MVAICKLVDAIKTTRAIARIDSSVTDDTKPTAGEHVVQLVTAIRWFRQHPLQLAFSYINTQDHENDVGNLLLTIDDGNEFHDDAVIGNGFADPIGGSLASIIYAKTNAEFSATEQAARQLFASYPQPPSIFKNRQHPAITGQWEQTADVTFEEYIDYPDRILSVQQLYPNMSTLRHPITKKFCSTAEYQRHVDAEAQAGQGHCG